MKAPDTRPYEMALLRGAFSPDKARELARKANGKLFGSEDTLEVFRCFQKLHFDRLPIDRDSIILELQSRANVDDEAGAALVDEVLALPEPANVAHLADGLGKLRMRAMLSELTEYLETPEAIKNGMGGAIAKINEFTAGAHMVSTKRPSTLSEVMDRILERTEPSKVWTPGLGKLDDVWKIRKGSFGLIGADSGGGKTSLMLNIALAIARQNTHIGIISIEMTAEELTFRMAAIEAGVDAARIEDNILSPQELAHIRSTIAKNRHVYDRVHVLDPAIVMAEELHGYYNELISRYGCEVIMTDYAQRIGTKARTNGKTEVVALTSETITAITKATGVASIVLSVLNETQTAFGERKKRKGLANFKHSGQLGHDAAWAVILSPVEGQDWAAVQKHIVIECVKSRKGQLFAEPVILDGPTQRIWHSGGRVVFEEAEA